MRRSPKLKLPRNALKEWGRVTQGIASALAEVECLRTLDRLRSAHGFADEMTACPLVVESNIVQTGNWFPGLSTPGTRRLTLNRSGAMLRYFSIALLGTNW